ncbi:MAG: hypothetical protein ACP5RZ_06335, partial [Thermoplasmata archaeon]
MIYSKYNIRVLNLNWLVNRYNFYSIYHNPDNDKHKHVDNIFVILNYNISFIYKNKEIRLFKPTNEIEYDEFKKLNTYNILDIYHLYHANINFEILRNVILFYTDFKSHKWDKLSENLYK